MDPRLQHILMRQQAAGCPDLQGTDASITLPVSDRLLNEILAEGVTLPSQVRELHVRARAGNRIDIRVKAGGSFFPAVSLALVIERQPELPASPVLVLKLELGALLAMAGPALRFLDRLPAGMHFEHDRIHIDLAKLAEQRGLAAWLAYFDVLRVDTAEGSIILTLHAAVRPSSTT